MYNNHEDAYKVIELLKDSYAQKYKVPINEINDLNQFGIWVNTSIIRVNTIEFPEKVQDIKFDLPEFKED